MKITTFLSVNNGNLGAIACMSNGTFCIVYKVVKVAPKQGFQNYVCYYSLALNPRCILCIKLGLQGWGVQIFIQLINRMTNSVGPDQMASSDLDLHFLQR